MKPNNTRGLLFAWTLSWAAICVCPNLFAANWTPTGAGPFSYNTAANWDTLAVPTGPGELGTFNTVGAPATQGVTLDAPITVGQIDLTNPTTSFTISNGPGGSFNF